MASGRSAALHTFGDAVADLLVDVAPIFERTFQHGLRHAFLEVPDDIGHEPAARRVVQYLAHHGAGLAEVVVFALGVGGAPSAVRWNQLLADRSFAALSEALEDVYATIARGRNGQGS
jgi:hypothetical protein